MSINTVLLLLPYVNEVGEEKFSQKKYIFLPRAYQELALSKDSLRDENGSHA